MTNQLAVVQPKQNKSLIAKIADRYSVEPTKMLNTLKATAFQSKEEITNEQMMALLIVADQYHLNPFTKEIYAFPDSKNGIVPVVGIDGWSRIINENNNFDGMEFNQSETIVPSDEHKPCPEWIECTIYRKDRKHPITVREYLDEVYRPPFERNGRKIKGPWQTHTKRFLRHKAMIQCSRVAFGFTGIFDLDEAERIQEIEVSDPVPQQLPEYPAAKFDEQLPGWLDAIQAGQKTADDIINMVSTKYRLTDEQTSKIKADIVSDSEADEWIGEYEAAQEQ